MQNQSSRSGRESATRGQQNPNFTSTKMETETNEDSIMSSSLPIRKQSLRITKSDSNIASKNPESTTTTTSTGIPASPVLGSTLRTSTPLLSFSNDHSQPILRVERDDTAADYAMDVDVDMQLKSSGDSSTLSPCYLPPFDINVDADADMDHSDPPWQTPGPEVALSSNLRHQGQSRSRQRSALPIPPGHRRYHSSPSHQPNTLGIYFEPESVESVDHHPRLYRDGTPPVNSDSDAIMAMNRGDDKHGDYSHWHNHDGTARSSTPTNPIPNCYYLPTLPTLPNDADELGLGTGTPSPRRKRVREEMIEREDKHMEEAEGRRNRIGELNRTHFL
ncbi:hypothetical protein D9758_009027 [Tetrapyrgos nigripes]|uniref:Uncharacterized protein n=1 Tax=Tetrapyrgos nigripes TaxID=182062 RepID=A0A8H5LL69_9AGAR|nr:hypothetical protein D9758_009027 [Tetrapyrgos nigripes]